MSNASFRIIRRRCQGRTIGISSLQDYIYPLHSKSFRYVPRTMYLMVEINELLATLTQEEKENESISHALDVRASLTSRNYHRLFRLYNSAPNMGGYLMDFFVERERVAACCIICKSYSLTIHPTNEIPTRSRRTIYNRRTRFRIRCRMYRIPRKTQRGDISYRWEITD
jgi:hypothetical protein